MKRLVIYKDYTTKVFNSTDELKEELQTWEKEIRRIDRIEWESDPDEEYVDLPF